MQVKTTMRYHLTPIRLATIKKLKKIKLLSRMLRNRNTCALMVGFSNGVAAVENSMKSLKNLKIEPLYC